MNIVLLSPHFPPNYYNFAEALHQTGANVFGIGDSPYEALRPELRQALTEYYWVDNLHSYDSLLRACAYFTYRHGKLDRLESHNEYWLETDARLRADFNIPGLRLADMEIVKRKSKMKQVFQTAGVDVASGRIVSTIKAAREFVAEVEYPVVAKPDIGVGAAEMYKIHSDVELERFFAEKPPADYFMEEFISGQLCSFDGLTDQDGRLVFYTSHSYTPGIMDVVNNDLDVFVYSWREIPQELERAGARVVRAFNVRERFFHIEFFYIEEKNHWVAVEINIRPPGGLMIDVFNYANDINLYQEWANVVVFNSFSSEYTRPYYCAYVGRKQHIKHKHTHHDIDRMYGHLIVHHEPVSPAFARAMGDYAYLLRSPDLEKVQKAVDFILAVHS